LIALGGRDGKRRVQPKPDSLLGGLRQHVRSHDYSLKLSLIENRYQFGQAFGGVVFPPYSESFGRKSVYLVSSLLYCVSCAVVGIVPSVAAAVVGRFISGIMSAVPSVVVSGSVEDLYNMKHRVWLMFLWACATTMGLLLGPIYGSYISTTIGRFVLAHPYVATRC
jgi:MFS family permease